MELKDRFNGSAEIKLKEGRKLNYRKRKHYKFNIFAYDCVDPPYDKRSKRFVLVYEAAIFKIAVYNLVTDSVFVWLKDCKLQFFCLEHFKLACSSARDKRVY